MNRRSFLRTASAAGLLPLMPALPAAAPVAAAAAPNEFMYGMAVFNARLRGASSAGKIARDLGISKDIAAGLHSRMVQDGFAAMPNAAGLSRVPNAFVRHGSFRKTSTDVLRKLMREKAEKLIETSVEDTPEEPADEALVSETQKGREA